MAWAVVATNIKCSCSPVTLTRYLWAGDNTGRAYGAGCSDNQGKELGQHKGPATKAVKTGKTEEPFTSLPTVWGHPSPVLLTTARQAHPWGTLHLHGGGGDPHQIPIRRKPTIHTKANGFSVVCCWRRGLPALPRLAWNSQVVAILRYLPHSWDCTCA